MDVELETQILFQMYHIRGYDGSIGNPDATVNSDCTTTDIDLLSNVDNPPLTENVK